MAFSGLLALIDDLATLADDISTMAATTARQGTAAIDDVATLTAAAAKKTTGIVTDDMAVTAEQALGILREREIPMVLRVARGSMFNKAVILAPGALLLNAVAPWSITPLLMAGGTFLAFEGVEKVLHAIGPHEEAHSDAAAEPLTPEAFEDQRVAGAIRTDLILSGEIIAITLGEVATAPFVQQVAVLYAISIVMTVGVYGLVGGLVKLDDLGAWMVERGGALAAPGRAVLVGTPWLLRAISIIGTVAMMMVGGHILVEGIPGLHDLIHHVTETLPVPGLFGVLADIAVGAVAGLIVVGALATGIPGRIWRAVRGGR